MTIARFPAAATSDQAALNAAADAANLHATCTSKTVAATPVTLSAAEFVNGLIDITVANSVTALTTPTAAQIVAFINAGQSNITPNSGGCQVGSTFEVAVMNLGSGTLTWTLGSGVTGKTTNDVTTVGTNKGMRYRCVVTNATLSSEAVKIQQMSFAAA